MKWKKIDNNFYRELDLKWKENKNNKAWVKMYEQSKNDLLGKTHLYRWRFNAGEIEIKRVNGIDVKDWFYWIVVALLLPIALFVNYLFLFASCEVVKNFWYLTYVPGRCL